MTELKPCPKCGTPNSEDDILKSWELGSTTPSPISGLAPPKTLVNLVKCRKCKTKYRSAERIVE